MNILNKLLRTIWFFIFWWCILPIIFLIALIFIPIALVVYILCWLFIMPFVLTHNIWKYE